MTDAIKFTQVVISRMPVCFVRLPPLGTLYLFICARLDISFQPLSDILIRFIKTSDADLISPSGADYVSIGTGTKLFYHDTSVDRLSQNGIPHIATTHWLIPNLISAGSIGCRKDISLTSTPNHTGERRETSLTTTTLSGFRDHLSCIRSSPHLRHISRALTLRACS